ncbi:MAG: hypothetical protein R3A48_06295 [Polyangiales bacterium]
MTLYAPRRASLLALGLLATAVAAADPPGPGGPPGGRRGPPQFAFDACANLSEGAACTVQTPRGTLQGSCVTVPQRGLACRPAGMGPGGPPPQG